jgi:hypothetical protein
MVHSEGGLWDSTCRWSRSAILAGCAEARRRLFRCEDCDEVFAFCSLCCIWVRQSERAADWLATISGSYASADMAGSCA